jgi:folate-binding protein YgfZ
VYEFLTAIGPDARSFLQGQLTQDLERLTDSSVLPAAWCSPKGRVIATLRVMSLPDGIALILPAGHAHTVLQRISIFRMRAKVDLAVRTDVVGVAAHATQIPDPDLVPDTTRHSVARKYEVTAVRLDDDSDVVELFGDSAALENAGLDGPLSDDQWRSAVIQAGHVIIDSDTSEKYTPHMLSLDLAGAISFSKGCYTGQEVVARTEHLGKSRRRLMRYECPATNDNNVASPGDDLLDDGRTVGAVVNAAGTNILAVTPADLHEKSLTLGAATATPAALPW